MSSNPAKPTTTFKPSARVAYRQTRASTPTTYSFGAMSGALSANAPRAKPSKMRFCVQAMSHLVRLGHGFPEQSRRAEHEHQDQHHERDHVPVGRVDERHRQAFDQTEDDAAQHGALEIADAAQHRSRERLQSRRVTHQEIDLRVIQ